MGFSDKVLFFFSALGAFNGLILSYARRAAVRIEHPDREVVAYFFDYGLPRIYLQFGMTACLFFGPFLYYYIKSQSLRKRLSKRLRIHVLVLRKSIS
jgi:hypothetical protein